MIFIGLDDTDTLVSRGTGNLARRIAAELRQEMPVLGVTRHQLLKDPRVPYTKNNSSAAIHIQSTLPLEVIAGRVREVMLADFILGSDPGLCVAQVADQAIIQFGCLAKREVVTQDQARYLAHLHGMLLFGLGGDQGGIIGALAAVGLASGGEDGRYIDLGSIRDLSGLQPVEAILAAGVRAVKTTSGEEVAEGMVSIEKLRPSRRGGQPVAIVQRSEAYWQLLKLD